MTEETTIPNEERSSAAFCTTHWSLVLAAGGTESSTATHALDELCRAYWYPLYAYVRRQGHTPSDAQDTVQDFFARLLERDYIRRADPNRGRFRTFLLTSLKRFLINEWRKTGSLKRGGANLTVSLDAEEAEVRFAREPATDQAPDTLYDRGWASVLVQCAHDALKAEFARTGKLELFEQIKLFVWGGKNDLSCAEIGAQLGMSDGAVKVAGHRLRQRYRELLRNEIAKTVATPAEVEAELRYLAAVIRAHSLSSNLELRKV